MTTWKNINSKTVFYLGLSLIASHAQAQTNGIAEIQKSVKGLAKQQVEDCLKDPSTCILPADVLAALEPNPNYTGPCAPSPSPASNEKKPGESDEFTTLLVTEIRSLQSNDGKLTKSPFAFDPGAIDLTSLPSNPGQLREWAFQNFDQNTGKSGAFQILSNTQEGLSRYVEGMIQLTASQPASINKDQSALALMTKMINDFSSTDESKISLLTILSDRLYANYNDSRDAFSNKTKADIPQGNIAFSEMISAAAHWNSVKGGVCNDIAQTVATLAARVFPNRDVLVINNGSHFGVLLNDKHNQSTIINWDRATTRKNAEASLGASVPTSNTRVSKVVGGKLQEIAVVDTETGQVLKSLIDLSGVPALASGVEPSVIYLEMKRKLEKENRFSTVAAKVAAAETTQTKMLILVGQHSKINKNSKIELGYAGGIQQNKGNGDQNLIFALHQGYERTIVRYMNPRVSLKASAGVMLDAQLSKFVKINGTEALTDIPAFSANAQLVQKVQFETKPKDAMKPQFSGTAMAVEALGSSDWGARQGAIATPGASGILKSLKYTNLHLNQIYLNGQMNVPLKPGITSRTIASYQGSNVGQKIDVSSGIEIKNANGMKIYAFVGYVDNTHGYKTQTSLLTANQGFKTGLAIETNRGAKFSTQVQGIGGNGNGPIANVNAAIPIFTKKKKK